MSERWTQLLRAYEGLVIRERVLILCACLASLYGAADRFLLQPMMLEGERLQGELLRSVEAIGHLEERSKRLAHGIEEDSPGGASREKKLLERQISIMGQRIEEHLSSMIPPHEVTRMLEQLLGKESDLVLVKLTSIDPARVPAEFEADDTPRSTAAPESSGGRAEFYRHGFVIELEGTYLAALHYLESIEKLPWDLSWNRITYRVIEHPRARVSIELQTLSREENWIGV